MTVNANSGCMYVAFGRPYLVQALHSLASLRMHSPSLPVCVITNVLREPPEGFSEWNRPSDTWTYVEADDAANREIKTDLARFSPFERSLYLDCDTEVLTDVSPMFRFLDHWDIALRLKEEGYAPHKAKGRQLVLDGTAAIHELPHWNSGVMLFASNPRVEAFFDLWQTYYRSGSISFDQVALVEAAFRSSCRILSLDARWNATAAWGKAHPAQKQIILHYMHGIDARVARRLLELDALVFGGPFGTGATAAYVEKRRRIHRRASTSSPRARALRLLSQIKRLLQRIVKLGPAQV